MFEFDHDQSGDAVDTMFVVDDDAYNTFSLFFNKVHDFLQYLTENNMFSNARKTYIHNRLFRTCPTFS
jgi:hypothetical protein